MKPLHFYKQFRLKWIIGIFCLGIISSCDNDFTVVADWKDIPVVYGLLNSNDTAQYIRLEKAFLDPSTNAFVLAQIPDSLYYNNAVVMLQELNQGTPVGSPHLLELVDANNEGYPKDEGIFASEPNFVYKTTASISDNRSYRLLIDNGLEGEQIQAETEVIGDFDIFSPQDGSNLSFVPGMDALFVWQRLPDAFFYEVTMEMRYQEFPIGESGQAVFKTIRWQLASRFKPEGNAGRIEVDGERFFEFVSGNIQPKPGFCRIAGSITVYFDAGGEDLLRHIEVFEANQTGITGLEPFPEYTNLSRGRGVFSTRYRKTQIGLQLSVSTKEALSMHDRTSDLGFSSVDNPCN